MKHHSSNTSIVIGTVVGGFVGALLALLYAPKSGKQLREDIAKKYDGIQEGLSTMCHKSVSAVKDKVQQGKEIVENVTDEAKHQLKDRKEKIKNE